MEEKSLTAEQSIQIIEKMLNQSRNKFYNNGFALLFWGFLIMLCFLLQFLLIKAGFKDHSYMVWPYGTGFGILVTIMYYGFYVKKSRIWSQSDSSNSKVWIGFGISYLVLMFLCIHLRINPAPFIWCLVGLGMFASGGIYRFKALYFGAVIFWVSAVICALINTDAGFLLIGALTMLLGYILPGLLLWNKAKKQVHV